MSTINRKSVEYRGFWVNLSRNGNQTFAEVAHVSTPNEADLRIWRKWNEEFNGTHGVTREVCKAWIDDYIADKSNYIFPNFDY